MDFLVQIGANQMNIKRKQKEHIRREGLLRHPASKHKFMSFPYVDDLVQIGANQMQIKRKHKEHMKNKSNNNASG